jgi:hypothetical protein
MNRFYGKRSFKRNSLASGALILLLAACGTTTVTMQIDVMSFLSDEELRLVYGDNPVIPGDGMHITIRSPVELIPLADDFQSVTEIVAIEIRTIIDFRNETGNTTIDYRIYFDSNEVTIFDSVPVVEQRVNLASDTQLRHEILIEGDTRLLNLFQGEEIAVASEIEITPGGGSENIAGETEISGLTVLVSAVGD